MKSTKNRMETSSTRAAVVFFSATGVTKTIAEVVGIELSRKGCDVRTIDVTPLSSRSSPVDMHGIDCALFGFPVFADFAPPVVREWIPTLDGKNRRCATFFTYGGRTTGYAHYHTKMLLERAGFRVQCSAEFPGRHSFNLAGWRVLPNRPDDRDFATARAFASLALERFGSARETPFELQKPFGYNTAMEQLKLGGKSPTGGLCRPVRTTITCRMCKRCETECPNGAFEAEAGESDPMKCIECMHCVYVCPDRAVRTSDGMRDAYREFVAEWHLTERVLAAKRSRIIAEPWQAAQ